MNVKTTPKGSAVKIIGGEEVPYHEIKVVVASSTNALSVEDLAPYVHGLAVRVSNAVHNLETDEGTPVVSIDTLGVSFLFNRAREAVIAAAISIVRVTAVTAVRIFGRRRNFVR